MKRAEVTWLDAEDHPSKWISTADAEAFGQRSCTVVSLGYIISDGPKYLTLGGDWCADEQDWGRTMKIPKGAIEKIDSWPEE